MYLNMSVPMPRPDVEPPTASARPCLCQGHISPPPGLEAICPISQPEARASLSIPPPSLVTSCRAPHPVAAVDHARPSCTSCMCHGQTAPAPAPSLQAYQSLVPVEHMCPARPRCHGTCSGRNCDQVHHPPPSCPPRSPSPWDVRMASLEEAIAALESVVRLQARPLPPVPIPVAAPEPQSWVDMPPHNPPLRRTTCRFCDGVHSRGRGARCPNWDATCATCGLRGHSSLQCAAIRQWLALRNPGKPLSVNQRILLIPPRTTPPDTELPAAAHFGVDDPPGPTPHLSCPVTGLRSYRRGNCSEAVMPSGSAQCAVDDVPQENHPDAPGIPGPPAGPAPPPSQFAAPDPTSTRPRDHQGAGPGTHRLSPVLSEILGCCRALLLALTKPTHPPPHSSSETLFPHQVAPPRAGPH